MIIDFDKIDTWGGELDRFFVEVSGEDLSATIKSQAHLHKYYEDHGLAILKRFGRKYILKALGDKLANHQVRLFHGTRLTKSGYQSVQNNGLIPLDLSARRMELEQILSTHPDWAEASLRMDSAIRFIEAGKAGTRVDDRIHFCLSRNGLLKSCNHYLLVGGEVDNHILSRLFAGNDEAALVLLKTSRTPYLVSAVFDFNDAVAAINPYGLPPEGSTLLTKLVEAWAYRKVYPDFTPGALRDSTAAYVTGKVAKLDAIEDIRATDLKDDD